MLPPSPNVSTGMPVSASRANSFEPPLAKMRRSPPSAHHVTPRLTPPRRTVAPCAKGSNSQRRSPVAASSAKTFVTGEAPYSTPSTTMGLVCIWVRLVSVSASPARYVQATSSRSTLSRVIWLSAEYWLLPAPR